MEIDLSKLSIDELSNLKAKIETIEGDAARHELAAAIDSLRATQERVNMLRSKCGMEAIEFPDLRRPMGMGKKKEPITETGRTRRSKKTPAS